MLIKLRNLILLQRSGSYFKFNFISLQLFFILSRFLMNCLKMNPNLLIKKIDIKLRNFNYNFLDIVKGYNLPAEIYYNYFLSIEEFKLKNLWNHIITNWNKMKCDLRENDNFLDSEYSKKEFHQIHTKMNDNDLNELLIDFIDNNHLKCFFVCNSIQNYITPK